MVAQRHREDENKISQRHGSKLTQTSSSLKPSQLGYVKPKRKVPLLKRLKHQFFKYQYSIVGIVVGLSMIVGIYITFTSLSKTLAQTLVNDPELIELVNTNEDGSIARAIEVFNDWTLGDIKSRFGNVFWSKALSQTSHCQSSESTMIGNLPENFDARDKWPKCFYESFLPGNCSSSWATATADMLSNRLCIMNTNKYNGVRLSPQDLLSCDALNKGCQYGALDVALYHAMTRGLVTTTCFPYRKTTKGVKCSDKCNNEKPTKIQSYCKVDDAEAMKREIIDNGPITGLLLLNDDILVYGGGVYEPLMTTRRLTDNDRIPLTHGVTILGWGEENGKEYWLIQTNFGNQWGENGYGKIASDARMIHERGVLAAKFIDPLREAEQQLAEADDTAVGGNTSHNIVIK